MLIPRYWAEARREYDSGKRRVTLQRFGWSGDGQAAALAMAESRVEDAMHRMQRGEALPRHDRKVPYNGADGMPIREEIVAEEGRAVLTRNAYGAVCLNVPDVLIADVDFLVRPKTSSQAYWGVLIAGALGYELWGWAVGLGAAIAVAVALGIAQRVRDGGKDAEVPKEALQRAQTFCDSHREWSLRVYRTPAGLRLIATHRTFDPDTDAGVIQEFFDAVQADPQYTRMCWSQRCFRARLTPKPWRLGMKERAQPHLGQWPVDADNEASRHAWVAAYDRAREGHAACRFVTRLGSSRMDSDVQSVVTLHDRHCRAQSDLPLA